jgi:hypothetical protein
MPAFAQHLTQSAFLTPVSVRESAWSEHVPFAFWLIEAFRPRTLVELGTYHGMSFLAFCQSIKANNTGTRAFAVDSWEGDSHAGTIPDRVHAELEALVKEHYPQIATLLRADFSDAVHRFADGSVDLLHIDGFHTYEAVGGDFHTWQGKLSDNAIVLFHDTQVRAKDFGVHKFWQEVSAGRPSFEFEHGFGLGVLGLGTRFPPAVEALFAAAEDDPAFVRAVFARLGRGVVDSVARRRLQQVQRIMKAPLS